jgi:selenocysteine-specific elongation factor
MPNRHLIIGTAGHIDHGKSALVLALTGTDPDRLKEEKARGITIDLGFAHWASGECVFSFVDVPGHERFVKNMLAGVGGIDAVLLVVAADESVMPQTREHFEICRLLGVPDGLVVITKTDLVDPDTIELVRMEVRDLAAGSFLAEAPIVAVSSRTGEGLDGLRSALAALAGRARRRAADGSVRMPVDRAFTVKGFGTVVTGTLLTGTIRVDDELVLLPGGRPTKVRGLQVHGQAAATAGAGRRVAANLGGLELEDIGRGDSLLTPDTLEPTRMLDARLQTVAGARPLRHGARVRFHQGTGETLGRVAIAAIPGSGQDGAAADGALAPGVEVPAGGWAYVRIRLESPIVVSRGDRFILRAYSPSVTIAGGLVLDPHPARGAIRTSAARARFEMLDPDGREPDAAMERAVAAMVSDAGAAGLATSSLVSRAGIVRGQVSSAVERLSRAGVAVKAGAVLVAPAVLERLRRDILTRLGEHHRVEPLSEGVPREEVRERLCARAGAGVFEHVLADLQQSGRVSGRERLAIASHRIALTGDEERARQTIEGAFRTAGLKPPDPREVAQAAGIATDVADRVVKLLARQKVLVKVDSLLFHQEALEQLERDMAALKTAGRGGEVRIEVATFKERYGVSRKFAIPLLEHLDRARITRRIGDTRVLI